MTTAVVAVEDVAGEDVVVEDVTVGGCGGSGMESASKIRSYTDEGMGWKTKIIIKKKKQFFLTTGDRGPMDLS